MEMAQGVSYATKEKGVMGNLSVEETDSQPACIELFHDESYHAYIIRHFFRIFF